LQNIIRNEGKNNQSYSKHRNQNQVEFSCYFHGWALLLFYPLIIVDRYSKILFSSGICENQAQTGTSVSNTGANRY